MDDALKNPQPLFEIEGPTVNVNVNLNEASQRSLLGVKTYTNVYPLKVSNKMDFLLLTEKFFSNKIHKRGVITSKGGTQSVRQPGFFCACSNQAIQHQFMGLESLPRKDRGGSFNRYHPPAPPYLGGSFSDRNKGGSIMEHTYHTPADYQQIPVHGQINITLALLTAAMADAERSLHSISQAAADRDRLMAAKALNMLDACRSKFADMMEGQA